MSAEQVIAFIKAVLHADITRWSIRVVQVQPGYKVKLRDVMTFDDVAFQDAERAHQWLEGLGYA